MASNMLAPYIRVSQTAGRSGETYISPSEQLATIQRWADGAGVRLAAPVRDEDVSGSLHYSKRQLGGIVERCVSGEIAGVVASALDRLTRGSLLHSAELYEQLDKAGARLVAVEDGIDTANGDSELNLGLRAVLAREEWRKRQRSWKKSNKNAVERGIHVTGKVPLGYARDESGRLEVDSDTAPIVKGIFEGRAAGDSWRAVHLQANKELRRVGRDELTSTAAHYIVRNRVYLGEARGYTGHVQPGAHEPIVTEELLASASAKRSVSRKARGKDEPARSASVAILRGGGRRTLARCAGCGRGLAVHAPGNGTTATYNCREKCVEPASVAVGRLDDYVWHALGEVLSAGKLSATLEVVAAYDRARSGVDRAQAGYQAVLDDREFRERDYTAWAQVREEAQSRVDQALAALGETTNPEDADVPTLDPGFGDSEHPDGTGRQIPAEELWPVERRRPLIRQFVREVRVAKSDPKRRRWQPLEERVTITWSDGSTYEPMDVPPRPAHYPS